MATFSVSLIVGQIEQNGEESRMNIKTSTRMLKVFIRYAQETGVQMSSLRFLLDGERIDGESTPQTLEIVCTNCSIVDQKLHQAHCIIWFMKTQENNDQFDIMLEQTGGW